MYHKYDKYRIVESIASSVLQYELYRDQVYHYISTQYMQYWTFCGGGTGP